MEMNRDQVNLLVNQVQRSHRLLAGFYKRILPSFDEIAEKFGGTFGSWDPIDFERPSRSGTKPSRKWTWDYLPLMNAKFMYIRADSAQPAIFEFHLHTEPAVLKPNRKGSGQPDPLKLEEMTPNVRVYLYWLKDGAGTDVQAHWEKAEFPEGDSLSISTLTESLEGTWWDVQLVDFIASPELICEMINRFVSYPSS
ncbi:hypothetical protein [Pseudomonas massiliensis]|uniref:hypothetical protein n=1 Tax=Pseudomonas massiliensis TaxID=522492 RepID=UPI0006939886|nr:hypothetical protein [Pseudomonas massiliensis]